MSRRASRVPSRHDLQTVVLGSVVKSEVWSLCCTTIAVDILLNTFRAIGKRDPGTSSSSSVCVNQKGVLQKKKTTERICTSLHQYNKFLNHIITVCKLLY
jgi:hypothetical protein